MQGYLKVKKFSFSKEPEQEIEVHKQINQYLKLKKNRNSTEKKEPSISEEFEPQST